ncbi:MAG: hypothetical protein ABEH81_15655, partial [Halopenitus sp.]
RPSVRFVAGARRAPAARETSGLSLLTETPPRRRPPSHALLARASAPLAGQLAGDDVDATAASDATATTPGRD